jgi:hypothetical protein
MFVAAVLVGGSITVALACRRWAAAAASHKWQNAAGLPDLGQDVDRHGGISVCRQCDAIVGEFK